MYTLLITFFLLSIIVSFLCSVWEAVLLSITPAYAEIKKEEHGKLGQLLAEFKEDIDRPLAALLTLNTIAHTVGAIGVGAQASAIWGVSFVATVLVPVTMTLAVLLLSEIIPKTIGANYWQELAPFTVKSLNAIIKLLAPLVYVSQLITKSLKKDKGASVLSRAEFTRMAEIGGKQGVIEESESRILKSVLAFNSVQAKDIMTPRTVIFAIDSTTDIRTFHADHPNVRFSRIPIYEKTIDHIIGYVLKDQVYVKLVELLDDQSDVENDTLAIGELRREIMVVPEQKPITHLFDEFTEKREHIALVVDEYGSVDGIVTMEDVLETLLGLEIVDELDAAIDMQQMARQQWETRARDMGLDID